MILGIFVPWSLVLAGVGLAYSATYCVVCALQARLEDVLAAEGKAPWSQRLRCRIAIAWLNFLEPLARDWGRLKGGLTPWRGALPDTRPTSRASAWWQRLQPFRRSVRWAYPGNQAMEKYALLDRLSERLLARGCAVGWNPESEDWDLKVRRGALGEAKVRMAVEHHGGARRLGRLSALIRPSKSVYWAQLVLAAAVAAAGALGPPLSAPLAVLCGFLGILWIIPIAEASRLEAALQGATVEAIADLGAASVDSGRTRVIRS
jgi:hypothetical protein